MLGAVSFGHLDEFGLCEFGVDVRLAGCPPPVGYLSVYVHSHLAFRSESVRKVQVRNTPS